ncbi:hypothetical protein DTO166G4_9286 [Paecilomyces variotii]|nr:hypothetical protein DTO166G4_9286 [Paecilomyces variotii]
MLRAISSSLVLPDGPMRPMRPKQMPLLRTKILVSRTSLLAAVVLVNTIVQVAGTVKGVDVEGAAGWGAIWAAATVVIGATFGWIEGVDGV